MPYTPPSGDALSFSWETESPYTPPAGDGLSFSFVPPTPGYDFGDLEIPVELTIAPYPFGDMSVPVELSVLPLFDALPSNLSIPVVLTVVGGGDMEVPVTLDIAYQSGDMAIPSELRIVGSGDMQVPVNLLVLGTSQKWRKTILLSGVDVSVRLTGQIETRGAEGAARIAMFTLSPDGGVIDPYSWVGADVIIEHVIIEGEDEIPQREFTGKVHLPEYNIADRTVRFTCTDDSQNKLANLTKEVIDQLTGGRFEPAIHNEPSDNWEYAQACMETVAGSLDASPTGAFRVTPWNGLPSWRTYDLTNTVDGSIDFVAPQRTGLINRIDLTFEYRFSRLHRATANIRYSIPIETVVNNMLPLLARTTVEAALESTGWEFYYGGNGFGLAGGGMTSLSAGESEPLQKDIHYVPYPEVYNFPLPSNAVWYQNESDTTCMEFSARMYKRWPQTVTETYNITVSAPESIARNGIIGREERATLASEWDASTWESEVLAEPLLDAAGNTQTLDYAPDATPAERDDGIETAVQWCAVQILGSHRSARVKGSTWLTPALDLDKALPVNVPRGTAFGKVVSVRHISDLDNGSAITEFEIAPSGHGAIGLPEVTPTPVVAPAAPDVVAASATWKKQLAKSLKAHIGGLATSPDFDEDWEGWIVNVQDGFNVTDPGGDAPTINPDTQKTERSKINDPYSGGTANPAYVAAKAYSATGFRIVLPGVEEATRNATTPTKAATYEIPIPVDEFTLNA